MRTAAGNLWEDFRPAKNGFIVRRAHQVLGEAIDLLERIVAEPDGLLGAIADGTFGMMRRPADGGRGGEDVVAKADDYHNPATGLLESGEAL